MAGLIVRPITNARDRRAFVDLAWQVYRGDPAWVAPLKGEVRGLIDPSTNPWFAHARAGLWLAERGGRPVGRISAQIDRLVLEHIDPGLGQWGMFEALDGEAAALLIATAEQWLAGEGMARAQGPISLSIWDEPGLLIEGFEQPPTVMMGHHRPAYRSWIEKAGYLKSKDLLTYELDIRPAMQPLMSRLVNAAERNPRLRFRTVDKADFTREARIILNLLNDAWSSNWGFVPLTEAEIAYAAKKLKPIIYEDLVRIAELDGEPVAFMLALPDINQLTADLDGSLFPLGWAKLLWRLRRPRVSRVRVPLMGVARKLHGTRMASQIAFTLIEHIRLAATGTYGVTHGEFGWVLEDNQGMLSMAELPGATVNKIYRIYEKPL